jgi:hypothetical protein
VEKALEEPKRRRRLEQIAPHFNKRHHKAALAGHSEIHQASPQAALPDHPPSATDGEVHHQRNKRSPNIPRIPGTGKIKDLISVGAFAVSFGTIKNNVKCSYN